MATATPKEKFDARSKAYCKSNESKHGSPKYTKMSGGKIRNGGGWSDDGLDWMERHLISSENGINTSSIVARTAKMLKNAAPVLPVLLTFQLFPILSSVTATIM